MRHRKAGRRLGRTTAHRKATMKNLARLATHMEQTELALAATDKGVELLGANAPPTLRTIALSLCVEAVINMTDLEQNERAMDMLNLVHTLAASLRGNNVPASLRTHFALVQEVLEWKEPADVSHEMAEAVAGRVPFGRVGGVVPVPDE